MKHFRIFLMNGRMTSIDADEFKCTDGWIIFYKGAEEFNRYNGGTVMNIETIQEEKSESKIISLK